MKALLAFVLSLALALCASAQIYSPGGGHGGNRGGGQTTVVVANGGQHHRGDAHRGSGSTSLGFVAGALFGAVAVQSQGSYYNSPSPSYQTSTNYGYSPSANYTNYPQPTPVPVTYYVAPAAPVYAASGGYPATAGAAGGGACRLAEQDVESARQQYAAAQQELAAAQERLEYAAAKYRAATAAAGSLR